MTNGHPLKTKQMIHVTRRFMVMLICLAAVDICDAQEPGFAAGCCNVPPGLTAQRVLLRDPSLIARRQAVQIITPTGSMISVLSNHESPAELGSNINVGLQIGQVYRLEISRIPRFLDYEVYPSIEVIDRLYPPAGLENQFPIKVVITSDDLVKAMRGRMVTKVVYLEDPKMSLPHRQLEDDQPYFDVGRNEDPLRTVRRLGRPMAIIRMGSRIPTSDEVRASSQFDFNSLPVEILPNPNSEPVEDPDRIPVPGDDDPGASIPDDTNVQAALYVQRGDESPQGGEPLDQRVEDGFSSRTAEDLGPQVFVPEPIGRQLMRRKAAQKKRYRRGEYIFDGQDSGRRVTVDSTWNVYGLDVEDTIGHFDTLDGQRLVTPSNRVAIYAPRFSAVRKIDDLGESFASTSPRQFEEERQTVIASASDFSATTKQHQQLLSHRATKRVSRMIDQTRGVTADNVIVLSGARNSFSPYENLEIIRFGRFNSAERARLDLGIQSAAVWRDDLGLQVSIGRTQPIAIKKVNRIEELESVDSDDNAILRVVKVASRIAARPGDIVEFTIRFDNLSQKKIGNVTIIDNLTSRLEYVPGSAESSHHATFITEPNKAGSFQLRWEIRDPLPQGEGGLVRFKCQVR